MQEKTYTTNEVADKIGVSYQTLHNWVNSNLIAAPKMVNVGKNSIYLWTKADIEGARRIKGTLKSGRKSKKK